MIPLGTTIDGVITRLRGRVRRAALGRAYQRVFAGDDGKLVLRDLLRRAGALRTSFDLRPGMTEWNEGRRSLALEILRELNLDERDFARMTKEITDEDRHLAE
jgi:hypothetical protein